MMPRYVIQNLNEGPDWKCHLLVQPCKTWGRNIIKKTGDCWTLWSQYKIVDRKMQNPELPRCLRVVRCWRTLVMMPDSSTCFELAVANAHVCCWLVVWLPFYMFPYIGNDHPNWLIFFRGVAQPPTSNIHSFPGIHSRYIPYMGSGWDHSATGRTRTPCTTIGAPALQLAGIPGIVSPFKFMLIQLIQLICSLEC